MFEIDFRVDLWCYCLLRIGNVDCLRIGGLYVWWGGFIVLCDG